MLPVRRDQSPISTANPNPVRVEIPVRQPSRATTAVNSESAAIAVISGVETPTTGGGDQDGLVVGLEGRAGGRGVEALTSQPGVVLAVQAFPS